MRGRERALSKVMKKVKVMLMCCSDTCHEVRRLKIHLYNLRYNGVDSVVYKMIILLGNSGRVYLYLSLYSHLHMFKYEVLHTCLGDKIRCPCT